MFNRTIQNLLITEGQTKLHSPCVLCINFVAFLAKLQNSLFAKYKYVKVENALNFLMRSICNRYSIFHVLKIANLGLLTKAETILRLV